MKAHPTPVVLFVCGAITLICFAPPMITKIAPVISYLVFWLAGKMTENYYAYDSFNTDSFNSFSSLETS